jgi:hypothetical protein
MVDKVSSYLSRKHASQANAAADIQQVIEGRKTVFFAKTFDLGTVRDQYNPEELAFQFRSFWVISATDNTATVSMIPNARAEGQLNGAITLKQNLTFKNGYPFSGAQFFWSAQSGKTMTVLFFVDADVSPGTQITQISGGVNIGNGSSRSDAALDSAQNQPSVTIGAGATLIVPADSARISMELQVSGGDIRLGGSTVTTAKGVSRVDGERWEDTNTGALYAIKVSGTPVITGIVYK